jgi:protein-arginine kinase activator protein McsA
MSLKDECFEVDILQLNVGPCEYCQEVRARVHYTQRRADPATRWLCTYCATDEEAYWEEMWREYYAGIL